MWVALLIIAIGCFCLGALWAMWRWRRWMRRLPPDVGVGIAREDVKAGAPLAIDLRHYFGDSAGCMFCRGRGFEPARFLSHDDEHCPERR
jgi:hypothetical protein